MVASTPDQVFILVSSAPAPEQDKPYGGRSGVVTTKHAAAMKAKKQLVLQKFDENGVARNQQQAMRTGSFEPNATNQAAMTQSQNRFSLMQDQCAETINLS